MHPGYFKDQTVYITLKYRLQHEALGSAATGMHNDPLGPKMLKEYDDSNFLTGGAGVWGRVQGWGEGAAL